MKQIKDYIGTKTAIHCTSREEAKQIIKLCFDNNHEWTSGAGEDNTFWDVYKYCTCYGLYHSTLEYCDLTDYYEKNYKIIPAREFLENNKTEYGYLVGSLNWAYEVAKNEGEVWHTNHKFKIIEGEFRKVTGYNSRIFICERYMTGWSKLKDEKEELIGIIDQAFHLSMTWGEYDKLYNILDAYEIREKEK